MPNFLLGSDRSESCDGRDLVAEEIRPLEWQNDLQNSIAGQRFVFRGHNIISGTKIAHRLICTRDEHERMSQHRQKVRIDASIPSHHCLSGASEPVRWLFLFEWRFRTGLSRSYRDRTSSPGCRSGRGPLRCTISDRGGIQRLAIWFGPTAGFGWKVAFFWRGLREKGTLVLEKIWGIWESWGRILKGKVKTMQAVINFLGKAILVPGPYEIFQDQGAD
jgi:hypothetical protein